MKYETPECEIIKIDNLDIICESIGLRDPDTDLDVPTIDIP